MISFLPLTFAAFTPPTQLASLARLPDRVTWQIIYKRFESALGTCQVVMEVPHRQHDSFVGAESDMQAIRRPALRFSQEIRIDSELYHMLRFRAVCQLRVQRFVVVGT